MYKNIYLEAIVFKIMQIYFKLSSVKIVFFSNHFIFWYDSLSCLGMRTGIHGLVKKDKKQLIIFQKYT